MQIRIYDRRKIEFEEPLILDGEVFKTANEDDEIQFSLDTGYEVVLEANEMEWRQFAQLIVAHLAEPAQKPSGA